MTAVRVRATRHDFAMLNALADTPAAMQQEVASKGVRVQVALPGATRTAIWEKAGTDITTCRKAY
jgi:short-subunit dehydrogenase